MSYNQSRVEQQLKLASQSHSGPKHDITHQGRGLQNWQNIHHMSVEQLHSLQQIKS